MHLYSDQELTLCPILPLVEGLGIYIYIYIASAEESNLSPQKGAFVKVYVLVYYGWFVGWFYSMSTLVGIFNAEMDLFTSNYMIGWFYRMTTFGIFYGEMDSLASIYMIG